MKKVVIIGGGFAGSQIAKDLEVNFNVTLIDDKDYFEYTPGILRVTIEPEYIKKLRIKHKDYLKKAKFLKGKAEKITKEWVKYKGKKILFDYLVIAIGSRYVNIFKGKKNVVVSDRGSIFEDYLSELKKAKKLLIVGGGLTGVELAGELCNLDKEVIIAHSQDKILERNNEKTINYATNYLERKGVEILYEERVKEKKKKYCVTENGTKIECDLVFLCLGITPSSELMKKSFPKKLNEKGYLNVNKYLQVEGFKNIFATGDIVNIMEEKTAQTAEKHAEVVIENISNLNKGKKLVEYSSKSRPMLISLGKYKAIFTYKNFTSAGSPAAFLKFLVEWWTMRKYR